MCGKATAPMATLGSTFPLMTRAPGRPLEEDGLAGPCDREQRLCFALEFWNRRDPILKERIFGLSARKQSGRARQGILVVSRRNTDSLMAQLALSLSAG
jgi:hypothetical protein